MPSFLYCSECNNLLYPREDRSQMDQHGDPIKRLMFACRNCDYQEEADNNCVYRNEIVHAPAEQTLLVQDLSTDPTLPRTRMRCAKCGHEEAVFFQAQGHSAEMKMTLYYICCNKQCGHRWFS
ncbi:DNA-directed RNA polymerase II core subunit rpb9 [Podila epicladia]|nr:DNA-directed RNA polymerase II core subunit rpb9 [Mortierella antarctica]KAG0085708.1 DNA-directed RNA polymerase II core subunit rpb9 [Podila epicladia]KAG0100255.1 DNA-directed RNA polymerase II core subunit rpb9 [Podila epicladia]KAG0357268.1 DNA-directed RNA polymerase II core subunit rpb9 [Podila minutissima]